MIAAVWGHVHYSIRRRACLNHKQVIILWPSFSSRYSGLSIKYVRGADPVIKLLDDADEIIEVRGRGQGLGWLIVVL